MIPTMIVFGLLVGRWWRPALLAAALLWPALLVIGGAVSLTDPLALLGGMLLGVANAAVGIAVVQGVRWSARGVAAGVRAPRRRRTATEVRGAGRRAAAEPSWRG